MLCQLSYTRSCLPARRSKTSSRDHLASLDNSIPVQAKTTAATTSSATLYAEYASAAEDSISSIPNAQSPESLSRRGSSDRLIPYIPATQTREAFSNYSVIRVTIPEPTVRPPSRMAKRLPTSIAITLPSSTANLTLSPGIHISAPPSRFAPPVTSVVRK